MKTNLQLRDELCDVFDQLRVGALQPAQAKELINAAGKIINTVKLELLYAALRKQVPSIEFLNDGVALSEPKNKAELTRRLNDSRRRVS